MRVGVVFSYFFAYQYAVVARSYSLDLALAPMIGWLFARRAERPLAYGLTLGLLANANAHSFVIAVPLGVEFGWTCLRRPWSARPWSARPASGVLLAGALGLAAVLQAWPPHDPHFHNVGGVQFMALRPLVLAVEGLVDRADPFLSWGTGIRLFPSGMAISLIVLIPAALLAIKAGRGWVAAAMMGSILALFLCVYSNYWHAGMVFLILLLTLWISWPALPELRRDRRLWLLGACAVLVAYQDAYAAAAWTRDLQAPYSASRSAAAEIAALRRDHPEQRIAGLGFKTLAVEPFFATTPFANAGPETGRFYRWRTDVQTPLYATPAVWAAMMRSQSYGWLLLSSDNPDHDFASARYEAMARGAGYCVARRFAGGLIWKTRIAEPDALILFGRCGSKGG